MSRKRQRAASFRKNRLKAPTQGPDPVPLTGFVAGRPASDIEERFGRALHSAGLAFRFQVRFWAADSLPGQEKVVDFLVQAAGWWYPVEVDGQIGHQTSAQRGRDAVRAVLLNEAFIRQGCMPLTRVRWYELESQEMANLTVKRIFDKWGL